MTLGGDSPAASASVRIGGYSLEVGPPSGSFAHFESKLETANVDELKAALAAESEDGATAVAAIEEFEDSASEVTGRIEEANKLFRAAASGQLQDPRLITGEINSLLDLLGRLDKEGRFEEQLKLMRSLNGLLVLALRWLELLRSLRSLLQSAEAVGHKAGQAWAHHELGSLHLCAGEPEEAETHLREALRIEREIGDAAGLCATRHNLDSARRDHTLPGGGRVRPPRRLLRLVALATAFALLGAAGTGIAFAIHGRGTDGSPTTPQLTHEVSIEVAGEGSGTVTGPGLSCPTDCSNRIDDGATVTLTAKADPGSVFSRWDGVDCRGPACTFTLTHDVTATASFTRAGDKRPPSVPTGLQATAVKPDEIDLSWQRSSDNVAVTGYIIFRDGARLRTLNGTTTTFRNTGLAPSTRYVYSVQATDAARNLSRRSHEADATTPAEPDIEPPTAPTRLQARAVSAGEIDLTWRLSSDNVAVTGYIIFRDGARLTQVSGTAATYADSAVAASTGYIYTVQATDAAGNLSPQSSKAKAKTPPSDVEPPTTPTGLTASPVSASEIDLAWSPSSDNVAVTGYVIYRDGARLTTVPATDTTFEDIGLNPATYTYNVQAIDAAGNASGLSKPVRTKTA